MELKQINKKGQLNNLTNGMLAIILFGIILVFGVVITQELTDTQITGAAGCNATDTSACDVAHGVGNATTNAVGSASDFVPLIVLAIVISVVLGLIIAGFAIRSRSR